MKKITLFFAFMLIAIMANAQVLLDETFPATFPNPTAVSTTLTDAASGWTTVNGATSTTWSKTTTTALTYPAVGTTWINSGVGKSLYVNYTGITSASSYSYKSFSASPITTGVVYLAFLYKCTANGGSGSQIIGLSDQSSTGNLGANVCASYSSPNLKLGVSRGSATNGDVQLGAPITLNTTYFLVMKYDFSVTPVKATLYVNPTIGGSESGATVYAFDDGTVNGKTARTSLQYIKQCTSGSNKAYFDVSGARVCTSWSDAVAPYISALPKITAPSPIVDAASVGPTYFTASWTSVAAASNYTVNVYSSDGSSLLKSQTTTGGTSTTSLVVTGLTPNTTYTYKVYAIATDQVNNANSLETALSNTFTTPNFTQLTTPTLGVATNILSESFIANWSTVTGAGSYVVKVYNTTPTLAKTVTATGQTTSSLDITGLNLNTSFTYTVTAKGDAITYSDSNESGNSTGFSTLSTYPASLNPNFSDGTWGVVVSSSPTMGTYPVFSVNGWDFTHAQVKTNSSIGPKGEIHSNVLMLDKAQYFGALTTPTVASVAEIEIHSSATAGRWYFIQSSIDGGLNWVPVGTGNTASPVAGNYYNESNSLEQIDIIPTGGLTNAKFKITDPASGVYTFYQISMRPTIPLLLTAPTIGVASSIAATTCTANWIPVDANGTNYQVNVFKVITSSTVPGLKTETTTLKTTAKTTGGQSTINLGITGLQADSTYIFKVKALGDGDVSYSDSYQTVASAQFTMGHQLATPVVGSANVSATGITANWTAVVTNVLSYDIKVYQGTTLVKTVNVADPNATTVNINGLLYATEYTFTVTAIGDNTTYFNSAESAKSAPATTDLGTGINKSESGIQLYFSNKELICSETGNIAIYNLQGAKMLEAQAVTKLKTNLASGIYFVKHTTANGQVTNAKVQIK